MFNWLFKKKLRQMTPEQQLVKEVEDVVQAMKESLGEAGRWEVKAQRVEETYKANTVYSEGRIKAGQEFNLRYLIHMVDTITGWDMTVKLGVPQHWSSRNVFHYKKIDTKTLDIDVHNISTWYRVVGVDVKNHEEYAYMPSEKQLASVYCAWWEMCVLPEIERQRTEREGKEMQTKREGLGKLKALYGKGKK